jgi:hypothetical protein
MQTTLTSPPLSLRLPASARLASAGLLAAKVAILSVALLSIAVPALHEFSGEAMVGRVAVYSAGVLLLPAIWAARGRRDYPLAADCFLTVPLLFDLVGNSFHLYGNVDHYDDTAHLIGLAFSAAFVASLLRSQVQGRLGLAGVAVAGGLAIGIAIELVEYVLFSHTAATGLEAYRDTIGDLSMDLLGAVIAGVLILLTDLGHDHLGSGDSSAPSSQPSAC